jgi:AcrR family transcriptional regulator
LNGANNSRRLHGIEIPLTKLNGLVIILSMESRKLNQWVQNKRIDMRTKTETRKQAILDAAAEVFKETGFERATMSEICARLGYSKATLYSYFPSKQDLFIEVISLAAEEGFQATHQALDNQKSDIRQALEIFGQRLLAFLYSPQLQTVRRLVVAEAGRSDLGKRCFELGPQRSGVEIGNFLQHAIDAGKLRSANTHIAAMHLKALLEAEWIEHFMCQTLEAPSPKDIAASVKRAVEVFMAAYGPQKN